MKDEIKNAIWADLERGIDIDLARSGGQAKAGLPSRRPAARRSMHLWHGRLAFAVAAFAVALAASAVVTTPGQAVGNWVGQRLGLSQIESETPSGIAAPGEKPGMGNLRELAHGGASPAQGQPAVVAASGVTPHGRHYELIAYRPKGVATTDGAEPICFELDFPEARAIGTFTCELPRTGASLGELDTMESELPGSSFSFAAGLAGADVAAVEVALGGQPAEAHLVHIPAKVLGGLGVTQPLNFFIAFLPAGAAGPVKVTGRDGGGAEVAEASGQLRCERSGLGSSGGGLSPGSSAAPGPMPCGE
jgi:hypothetical protein